jgi:hypothetical protein
VNASTVCERRSLLRWRLIKPLRWRLFGLALPTMNWMAEASRALFGSALMSGVGFSALIGCFSDFPVVLDWVLLPCSKGLYREKCAKRPLDITWSP